jgi:hypothetical protein
VLPLSLFVAITAYVGFWGVNIEDGGLILAQSRRLLFGEIPHRDFITPRPAGSAFLHLVDFALPLPLELSSKIVTVGEFVAYGVAFSLFVYGRRLDQLSLPQTAGAVAAVLIGMHQFPIIPFYTIDGLVGTGVGFLLFRRGLAERSNRKLAVAFLLFGITATTKQSFWFVPFFSGAWLVAALAIRRSSIWRPLAVSATSCALAPCAYISYVTAGGGFSQMRAELTETTPVYGDVLLTQLRDAHLRSQLLPSLVALGLMLVMVYARSVLRLPASAEFSARALGTVIVLHLVTQERLGFNGNWSQRLFWCAVVAVVIRSIAWRRVDVVGLTTIFTAWMVTLSWGAPTPALAAGVTAIYLADALWRGTPKATRLWLRFGLEAGAVAATALVAYTSVHVRTHDDYGVLRGTETRTLGGALRGVSMEDATADYLAGAKDCAGRFPARWTAVVPQGALAYALYGFRNPFPIDWFWPPDYAGANGRNRLIDAAQRTDKRGNYLVLFQKAPFPQTPTSDDITSFNSDPDLGTTLEARLTHATRIDCGLFVAFYDRSS